MPCPRAGKVRQHGAGRQHVEAASDQGLEYLKAGIELTQFEVEPLFVKKPAVHPGPDLAVDRDRMQIADADLGLGLRDGGRGSRKSAERDARGGGQKLSSIHGVPSVLLDYSENDDRANLRLLRAIFVHHELSDVTAQLAEFGALLQRFVARIGERHVDDLLDPGRPRRHHHDARGEIDRLFHRMGDQHDGLAFGGEHLEQQSLHVGAGLGIERAERLVHQQKLRLHRIGPRDREPLPHAAGQMLWIGIGEIGQPHQRQIVLADPLALR